MNDKDRCPECGSWGECCVSDEPVPDCGCARCLSATIERLKQVWAVERKALHARIDAEEIYAAKLTKELRSRYPDGFDGAYEQYLVNARKAGS